MKTKGLSHGDMLRACNPTQGGGSYKGTPETKNVNNGSGAGIWIFVLGLAVGCIVTYVLVRQSKVHIIPKDKKDEK